MTAVRDIEQDEKPGRPVLSMRVKASVVGASFLVLLGLIACQEMPNAVQALRSLGQSATLVGNESQPPEREIPPGSLEQENPVQVENEPPPELVEEEEPLGQETASLEEEAPTVVLSPDLVASATLPLFPAVAASGPKILWNRTYGGPGDDVGSQIIQAWGDYVVAGYTTSFGAYREDFYLLKIDDAGNMLWNETYERSTQIWQAASWIPQTEAS